MSEIASKTRQRQPGRRRIEEWFFLGFDNVEALSVGKTREEIHYQCRSSVVALLTGCEENISGTATCIAAKSLGPAGCNEGPITSCVELPRST